MYNYYLIAVIRVILKNGDLSDELESRVGVKQGGYCSPDNFNCLLDAILNRMRDSSLVIKMNGKVAGAAAYADDMVEASFTPFLHQKFLNILETYCDLYDISINVKKIKWMVINGPMNLPTNFFLNNQKVEQVDFKYLGYEVKRNGSNIRHISRRKTFYMGGIKEIEKINFLDRNTHPKMKGLLYSASSKLLYGMELINFKSEELKDL